MRDMKCNVISVNTAFFPAISYPYQLTKPIHLRALHLPHPTNASYLSLQQLIERRPVLLQVKADWSQWSRNGGGPDG